MNATFSFTKTLLLLSFSSLLASCSSISKEDCAKNMRDFGYDHGRKGQVNLIEEIKKSCLKRNPNLDLLAYQTGFESGWKEYCTPFNGYRMGARGELYRSFCSPERETLFHERFLIGKKVYEQKDQARELQEKIMDLTEEGKTLTTPAAHEELTRYKNELSDLTKEIQRLEQMGMSNVQFN